LYRNSLIFDCEIVKCIPPTTSHGLWTKPPDLEYCRGWSDFEGMGISVIAAYDYLTDRYRIFFEDNLSEFAELVTQRDTIIGFNSLAFDDKLCNAHGIPVTTTYDLLCEVRKATGQPPHYRSGTRPGYKLENLAQANLGHGKTASGAFAPELWQRGHRGHVTDYCLEDVRITKTLLELGIAGELKDPTGYGTGVIKLPEVA
jgi:hypothetical protein